MHEQVVERIVQGPSHPDDAWFTETARMLYELPLCVREDQLMMSPKGFPYFALYMPAEHEKCQSATIKAVMDYVIQWGLGVVLSLADGRRFWELTHGHMLSWRLYGTPNPPRFWNAPPDTDGKEVLQEPEMIQVGQPNEQMLPPLVRDSLRRVMTDRLGIANPRVGLISRSSEPGVSRIVFDLDEKLLGGEEGAVAAYGILVWYLPYCIPSYHMPGMAGASWMVPL